MDCCIRLDRYPEGAPVDQKELMALSKRARVSWSTTIRWLARLPVYKTKADQLEAALAEMRTERGKP